MFELGSIAKTFTAIAAMQAHEKGLLDLHAPVTEYLPWFQVPSKWPAITAHHLLSHSAGLIYSADYSPDPRGAAWNMRRIGVRFEPGTDFYYSEAGYQTLGLLLEAVCGRPLEQIIRQGIFEPLAMHNSRAAITHALRPRMARGYAPLYDDRPYHRDYPLVPAPWLEFNSGDGCVVSTATDVCKFLRMLLCRGQGPSGPVLTEASFEQMVTPVVEEAGYGYGVYSFQRNGRPHLAHGGDMPGYQASIAVDLERGIGVTWMGTQPCTWGMTWTMLDVLDAAHGSAPLPQVLPLPDPARIENALEYAGTYRCGDKKVVLVARESQLTLHIGGETMPLERRGTDSFHVNDSSNGWDLYLLEFGRVGGDGPVVEAFHGPDWYIGEAYDGPSAFDVPSAWSAYVGHYRAHNPWISNFRVLIRKERLILDWQLDENQELVPLEDGSFQVGTGDYRLENLRFDQVADGRALRATWSGYEYYRTFTP
jgi:hypothetical protein